MTPLLEEIRHKLDGAVEEDPEHGIYRGRRDAFTDPDLFELEMKYIFEGNWIYLAHESQLPNNNDYLTTYIGRQPIVISRDKKGELHALINACSHRGAMLCRRKKDNRSTFTCPFHGWTFSNNGKLLKVKDPRGAGYPEQFNTEGSHDLTKVPRFESYRGFLFGSLNPDVLPAGGASRRRREDHRHDRRPVAGGPGGAQGRLHLHLRRQLEGTGRERRRRLPRRRRALELRGDHRPPHLRRVGHRDQGHGRRAVGQAARRLLRLGARPRPALERMGQPGGPAAVGPPRRDGRGVRPGHAPTGCSVSRAICACTRTSTSWTSSARRSGTSGRSRWTRPRSPSTASPRRARAPSSPHRPHPPVRGLLQRQRHGHPGRPGGVPLLPEDLPGRARAVERHEPGRGPLDRRPGRRRQGAGSRPGHRAGSGPRTRASTSSSTATGIERPMRRSAVERSSPAAKPESGV